MELTFNIMMVNGLYIHQVEGDGTYYFLYELTVDNLNNYPPKLLNENDINEWSEWCDHESIIVDENTGYEFGPSDVVFREVKLIV